HFKSSIQANGADSASQVDALTEPGAVILKQEDNKYPSIGVLYTVPKKCGLGGNGRVSVTSEYIAGTTAISSVETSTSDDLEDWTPWQPIGPTGELISPNRAYIRYRITLTTEDETKTPKLIEVVLHDIPKPAYEKLGFAKIGRASCR